MHIVNDYLGTATFGSDKGDGEEEIILYLGIENSSKTVFINVTGSTQQWFAIGFGVGSSMKDKYAIIIDWTTGALAERQLIDDDVIFEYFLGNHAIGQELTKFVERKTQFDTTSFRRNVLMERPTFRQDDVDGNYFNFSVCNKRYDIVWARGRYSGNRNDPPRFGLGAGHATFDRGSGTIQVTEMVDGQFGNCSWTISIFQGINWKLIISLISIIIFNIFY